MKSGSARSALASRSTAFFGVGDDVLMLGWLLLLLLLTFPIKPPTTGFVFSLCDVMVVVEVLPPLVLGTNVVDGEAGLAFMEVGEGTVDRVVEIPEVFPEEPSPGPCAEASPNPLAVDDTDPKELREVDTGIFPLFLLPVLVLLLLLVLVVVSLSLSLPR